MAENSAIVAEYSAKEKEIMAENSAIVAEYSAREKEKLWLSIQQLWPSIRQENELWLSIQQNMAEVSAREKKYG